jgi:hypothetical protein
MVILTAKAKPGRAPNPSLPLLLVVWRMAIFTGLPSGKALTPFPTHLAAGGSGTGAGARIKKGENHERTWLKTPDLVPLRPLQVLLRPELRPRL